MDERIECICGCGGVIEWTRSRSKWRRPTRLPGHTTPALQAKYEAQRMKTEPNPSGLCQCGCGERTPISRWTNSRVGSVKGKPTKFVLNHQLRGVKRGEGRYLNSQGYVLLRMPDHPQAHKGYILEHRWVMEQSLGRPLIPSEAVHHQNHVKTDNRAENLLLMDRDEHGRAHGRPTGWRMTDEERADQSKRMTNWWTQRKT